MTGNYNGAVPEKNPYPPHGRSSEIPGGRGVLKVKILEAKYEAKLETPRGDRGAKQKPSMGEYGYVLEQHNLKCRQNCACKVTSSIRTVGDLHQRRRKKNKRTNRIILQALKTMWLQVIRVQ